MIVICKVLKDVTNDQFDNDIELITRRYIHSRLRTHAESIAFFGGGSRQQAVSPEDP